MAALIRYGNEVRELDAAQLEQQHLALLPPASRPGDTAARIKLALLLSDPDAPFHDDAQALRVLGEAASDDSADPAAALARLLQNLLQERAGELDEARALSAAERAQRETLQGQLDALKSLEQQISAEGIDNPN